MTQGWQSKALDVVRSDKVTAIHERRHTCRANERKRSSRAAAQGEARPISRRACNADGISDYVFIDALARRDLLNAEHGALAEARSHVGQGKLVACLVARGADHDGNFLLGRRIVDLGLQQK